MSGTEVGIAIGATSIITAILAKLKCYYKMNSEYPCACGFTETQIADNDDVHINHTTVNGVDLLYVGKRRSTDDEANEITVETRAPKVRYQHCGRGHDEDNMGCFSVDIIYVRKQAYKHHV